MSESNEVLEYTVKVYPNGNKNWYLNGKLHREDGPAVEWSDGTTFWYREGKYCRKDGPAVEYPGDAKFWYHQDIKYTEAEFNAKHNPVKELTVAEISRLLGYEVKIVK